MAKKVKQQVIPGSRPDEVADIEEAADSYYDAMKARVKASAKETETRDDLMSKMIDNKLSSYETREGLIVNMLDGKKKVTVKPRKDEENGADEGGEET